MDKRTTEVERSRRKEEFKRDKDMYKALETPEQKRARRLAKKVEKERNRKKLMGWDDEYAGYTNEDNPFGDSNLHETFIWGKKYEKLGHTDLNEEKIRQMNKQKMIRNKEELEKVKKARLEREREREERNEEMSRMQRDKEADQFKEWAKQEDYFHLKQAKLRSKLRIKEGRAKPIDVLARYINVFGDNVLPSQQGDDSDDPEALTDTGDDAKAKAKAKHRMDRDEEELKDRVHVLQGRLDEPYNALNGLRIKDMEDLEEDIRIYMELDSGAQKNADYWRDLQIIVEDELAKLKLANLDMQERRREGINPAVSAEIAKLLAGKSSDQLKALKGSVEKKITSKEEGIDIGYWETMLSRLRGQIARARLRQFHEESMARRTQLIELFKQQLLENRSSTDDLDLDRELEEHAGPAKNENVEELRFLSAAEKEQKCLQEYRSGGYSPKPLPVESIDTESLILSLHDRYREIDEQRHATLKRLLLFPTPFVQFDSPEKKKKVKGSGKDKGAGPSSYDHNGQQMSTEEEAFVREARKGMNDDEAIFSVEEEPLPVSGGYLQKQKYSWAEKYRPRKPRYFNRVHTGFEWNKYNQTHYDVDNPPPKVVQGYKFNIFYPDLIDKSAAPTFKITPCPENKDFAYIRFSAGPPYEDICFKIVNREWNYSYKSGYRSQFQNNILQLWFHFKRYRYRR